MATTGTGAHIITADGRNATASVQHGRRGGQVLVIDVAKFQTVYAAPVEHVTRATLQTVLDPGTASTVLDLLEG